MTVSGKYEIRRLGSGDVAALRAVTAMFGDVFEEPDTYGDHPPDQDYLARWLSRSTNIALIAEAGGDVVGGLVAYVWDKFERAQTEIYLYDLAVVPEFRRRGVATGLMDALRPIAKGVGAHVIMVQTEADNEAAITGELAAAQGAAADIGGYYHPDEAKLAKVMRPSATLNALIQGA